MHRLEQTPAAWFFHDEINTRIADFKGDGANYADWFRFAKWREDIWPQMHRLIPKKICASVADNTTSISHRKTIHLCDHFMFAVRPEATPRRVCVIPASKKIQCH